MRVNALIEPQILKLAAEIQQAFCLICLRTEFIQVKKLAQRFIAGAPCLLIKYISVDRSGRQLQIDGRVYTKRCIVDHLRERVQIIGRLRADNHTQAFAALAHTGAQAVEQIRVRRLRKFIVNPKRR